MIIFLGIDGVLTTQKSYQNPRQKLYPPAVSELNRITRKLNAKIVVSSGWRFLYSLKELTDRLESGGVISGRIIDVTPPSVGLTARAGVEIKEWLIKKKPGQDFVIINEDCRDIYEYFTTDHVIEVVNGWHKKGLTKDMVNNFLLAWRDRNAN
jgi:hypothetical protein